MTEPTTDLDHVQLVMGTGVRYALRGVTDTDAAAQALDASVAWLEHVDHVFSTYRPDSAVSRLRTVDVGDPLMDLSDHDRALVEDVVTRCAQAYDLSDGCYDPWSVSGGFDPSGLVKGWSQLEVSRLLRPVCSGFLVDAGGDLLVWGRPAPDRSWRVGVRHPLQPDAVASVLSLDAAAAPGSTGVAVATSAAYARGEHVVDPRTGEPARALLSATVVGPDPGLADALATAAFVEGLDAVDRIVAVDGYAAFLVDADRCTWSTPGLPSASGSAAA